MATLLLAITGALVPLPLTVDRRYIGIHSLVWLMQYRIQYRKPRFFVGMNYLRTLYRPWTDHFSGRAFYSYIRKIIAVAYTAHHLCSRIDTVPHRDVGGIHIWQLQYTSVGWHEVRQIHVLAYSYSIWRSWAAVSFYLGIRCYKDDLARDFGVLFLLINLYTRYFESLLGCN